MIGNRRCPIWLRTALLLLLCVPGASIAAQARAPEFASVTADTALQFPRDHGSHPAFRTEWWYITGWLRTETGRDLGVQITFFRHRTGLQENSSSRFAPRQLIFAHAALADLTQGKLLHDQQVAREGFGLAGAAQGETDVHVNGWTLKRESGRYLARINATEEGAKPERDVAMDLAFTPRQALLLQGEGGFSRKGPQVSQASHYYSIPHLQIDGSVTISGHRQRVTGTAWLDHEWSSEYLAPEAVGWDWTGINLDDGGALMVFRLRDRAGQPFWAGGTHRDAQGRVRTLSRSSITFTPQRHWRSPRTGVKYPVAMRVRVGDDIDLNLLPLMDDQELDARGSTGTLYWEGAVRAMHGTREIGRGYLELTGYQQRLRM